MSGNLGIMRFRYTWMRTIRAFVTDLDTWPLLWLSAVFAWLLVSLAWLPAVLAQRTGFETPAHPRSHSTRVGVYWPGVVRTARDPDLRGVHLTVGQ